MIFVLRTPEEGYFYEVVGHRLDDVEDRRTTPIPSVSNCAIDVVDGQRWAVDMNVDGDDIISSLLFNSALTSCPYGKILIIAHTFGNGL